jgi:formylglycine-generating enzyme required for sulfatase activity
MRLLRWLGAKRAWPAVALLLALAPLVRGEHLVAQPSLTPSTFTPLSVERERALKPKDSFSECAVEQGKDYCPEMVVVPAGSFLMGSPPTEKGRDNNEGPQHKVTIARPFAVSKYELTFDEWDTCAADDSAADGSHYCYTFSSDPGMVVNIWGRGKQPVVFVNFEDAQQYVAWISKKTGKPYRLLSEAEYEYATRAGTTTEYPWGDDIGKNNANCDGCGSQWDNKQPAPVGSFVANHFGLYDMVGNVYEWTQDCWHISYNGAPTDGSAWTSDCNQVPDQFHSFDPLRETQVLGRVVRGGSRSASRDGVYDHQGINIGFRVARTLVTP